MTVLVTGAGGFLGGNVVRELVAQGRAVRTLDLEFPTPLLDEVEIVTGSILDPDHLAATMGGVTHIVHAAAIAHLWTPGRFDYDRVNVVGTCRVLAEARRIGAKVVHVSSFTTLVGKDTPADEMLDETVEIVPNHLLGPYPRSKRQAELAVLSAVGAGVDACIVMPGAPVGAGDHRLTPPTAMLRDLAAGKIPALLNCSLNLVDARAVARAIVTALEAGEAGHRYLLTGEDLPIDDFARMVAELSGVPAPRRHVPLWVATGAARAEALLSQITKRPPKAPLTGVRLAGRPARFDNTKARESLRFSPRPVRDCLPEALDWLRAAGHL